MSLYTHKRADNVKWVIAFVLIAVLLVGMAVMAVKISDKDTTLSVSVFDWEIGTIAGTTGEELPLVHSIRMKKAVNVDGLEITFVEDPYVEYSLFFYTINEDGEEVYLSCIEGLSEDFDATTIPEDAKLFRVVITPGYDVEVNFFEIGKYAELISIVYNK